MSKDEEDESSRLRRIKERVNRKMDDVRGDMLQEIKEELDEHDHHVQDARDLALGKFKGIVSRYV